MPPLLMTDIPTSQMRVLWADHFKQGYSSLRTFLGRENVKTYDFTWDAWRALEAALQVNGYGKASIVSTYYPRLIAGTSVQSLHGYSGVALDIDPGQNPFIRTRPFSWADTRFTSEQVEAVKAIRTISGAQVWRWGGDSFGVNTQDYMHWQLNCSPSDIESGIDWDTVPKQEDDEVKTSNPAFQPSFDRALEAGMFTENTDPLDEVTAEKLAVFLDRVGVFDVGGGGLPADAGQRLDEVEMFVDELADKVGGIIATLRSVG